MFQNHRTTATSVFYLIKIVDNFGITQSILLTPAHHMAVCKSPLRPPWAITVTPPFPCHSAFFCGGNAPGGSCVSYGRWGSRTPPAASPCPDLPLTVCWGGGVGMAMTGRGRGLEFGPQEGICLQMAESIISWRGQRMYCKKEENVFLVFSSFNFDHKGLGGLPGLVGGMQGGD